MLHDELLRSLVAGGIATLILYLLLLGGLTLLTTLTR